MLFTQTLDLFKACLGRASNLCAIYQHLKDGTTDALNVDDLLRSAVTLTMSSFDYLIHELIKVECIYRVDNNLPLENFNVPSILLNLTEPDFSLALDAHIKTINGHKSFMAPDKVAQSLKIFLASPWNDIGAELGIDISVVKSRLKAISDWRNRIVHEADIHPDYGGTQLWPINYDDVMSSIEFIEDLGQSIALTITNNR